MIPVIPPGTPQRVIEIIEAILERKNKIGFRLEDKFQFVIDYSPGDVKVIVGKMTIEPDEDGD